MEKETVCVENFIGKAIFQHLQNYLGDYMIWEKDNRLSKIQKKKVSQKKVLLKTVHFKVHADIWGLHEQTESMFLRQLLQVGPLWRALQTTLLFPGCFDEHKFTYSHPKLGPNS